MDDKTNTGSYIERGPCCSCGKGHWHEKCDICSQFVCPTCSPSTIQIEETKTQTVCKLCMAVLSAAPHLQARIERLAERLHGIVNSSPLTPYKACSVDDALNYCEEALPRLANFHKTSELKAYGALLQFGLRARRLNGGADEMVAVGNLDQLITFCQGEVRELEKSCEEASLSPRRASLSPRRRRRNEHSVPSFTIPSSPVPKHCAVDSGTCPVCSIQLKKLSIKVFCRICKQVVCRKCCPNSVHMDEHGKNQRVCTCCIQVVVKAPELLSRWSQILERLNISANIKDRPRKVESLLDATNFCENALTGLEYRFKTLD